LPEEYQFLYDTLLLADRSHATALAWLDKMRKMGMDPRFSEPVEMRVDSSSDGCRQIRRR